LLNYYETELLFKERIIMRKYILSAMLLLGAGFAFNYCSSSTDSETGHLKILLTDAPADYNSVMIYFSEISAHIDSGWVTVLTEPTAVDLLQYSNGETFLMASEDVAAGHYTQIRVKIDSAFVDVDGTEHPLTVPSGAKTGLKFGPQFTISEGSTYTLVLDFDATRSVIKSGKTYKLKPHIRIITEATSGSVSGTVLNPVDAPVATAFTETDTMTTFVDVSDGSFMLAYLPAGVYTVAIEDSNGLSWSQDDVPVSVGEDSDLGDITLQ